MPLVSSKYQPPKRIFRNPDISTLYAALIRKVDGVVQKRERMELPDGDFLDLDWSYAAKSTDTCVILLHGLEGHAGRPYILGMAKVSNANGMDTCAPNYRGCSGESNRTFGCYHSGKTEDLDAVVRHVLNTGKYRNIIIQGFSLGGNLTLKYLGEERVLPEEIKAGIAVSTPVDLEGCMYALHEKRNFVYAQDFLKTLKKKLIEKQQVFPHKLSLKEIRQIKSLKQYDDYYTSRANGFKDALDYYRKASSKQFLSRIRIPTFIINAKNDTFLSDTCYPISEAEENKNIFLEIPKFGGHVGFEDTGNLYYPERRFQEFIKQILK